MIQQVDYQKVFADNFRNLKWLVDEEYFDFIEECKKKGRKGEITLSINRIGQFVGGSTKRIQN